MNRSVIFDTFHLVGIVSKAFTKYTINLAQHRFVPCNRFTYCGFGANSHCSTMQRIVVLLPLISRIVLLLALRPPLLLQRPCSRRCPLLLLHSVSWSVQDDGSPEEEPTTTTTTLFFANDDSPLLQQTGTESLVLELKQHKPMGCTVEESLADRNILFVSSVVSGGNADTTGLRVGDVLSGMTGLFGTVESTQGMDLGTLYVSVVDFVESFFSELTQEDGVFISITMLYNLSLVLC